MVAPPLSGTYEMVYGNLPAGPPVPGPQDIVREAGRFFRSAPQAPAVLVERVLDKPDGHLPVLVRLLGTHVKPAAYHAAVLNGAPALDVWRWRLAGVIPWVEPVSCPSLGFSRFFDEMSRWGEVSLDPDRLRAMFLTGYSAVLEARDHVPWQGAAKDSSP